MIDEVLGNVVVYPAATACVLRAGLSDAVRQLMLVVVFTYENAIHKLPWHCV